MINKIQRWIAVVEACSDKRVPGVVAEMRDMIEQLASEQAAGVKLLTKVRERGDLIVTEDGYTTFWADSRGFLSAWHLRVIAAELDRINQDWDDQIKRDLGDARTRLQDSQEIRREHEMVECP